jgi:hypothetical protein
MTLRNCLPSGLLLLSLAAFFPACGGDNPQPTTDGGAPGDAGPPDGDATLEAAADGDAAAPVDGTGGDVAIDATSDGGADAANDGAPDVIDGAADVASDAPEESGDGGVTDADAGPAPSGLLIAPGKDVELLGMVGEDAIYVNGGLVYATDVVHGLLGGLPRDALWTYKTAPQNTFILDNAVYEFGPTASSCAPNVQEALTVWAGGPARTIALNASNAGGPPGGPPTVSVGSVGVTEWVAYEAWADDACQSVELDLVPINLNGGPAPNSPAPIVPCTPAASTGAVILPSFAANGVLVTNAWCPADGGARNQATLYAPSTFAPVSSFPGTGVLDPTGTWLMVLLDAGGAQIARTSDGTVVANIASAPSGLSSAMFSPTGDHAYFTANGALESVDLSVTPSTTTVLAPSGILRIMAVDPNNRFVLDFEAAPADDAGADAGLPYLVNLRATVPGATPVLLTDVPAPSAAEWSVDFTADGNYALGLSCCTGTLSSLATSAVSSSEVATGLGYVVPLSGSKVIGVGSAGWVFDLSGSSGPRMFSPGPLTNEPNYPALPAVNGTKIVYSTNANPPGLYVASGF